MHAVHKQVPANRLKATRERRGVTLKSLADACGVYVSTVKRWETRGIPAEHQGTVAARLDVSVPYLTGWAADEEPYMEPAA
jgi:transcriptional regulator with XRE-family HTH domain